VGVEDRDHSQQMRRFLSGKAPDIRADCVPTIGLSKANRASGRNGTGTAPLQVASSDPGRAPETRITKAVVLAGGPGTALMPLANLRHKLALPVANEPLIRHLTRFLHANGINDAAVVGNGQLDNPEMQNRLRDACEPEVQLTFYTDRGPRGTAGSLTLLRAFLDDSPFLVVESGVLAVGLDLYPVARLHAQRGAGLTVVVGGESSGESHIERIDMDMHDRIRRVRILERSVQDRLRLRPKGIYIFSREAFDRIPATGYVDIKEQLIPYLNEEKVLVCAAHADGYARKIGELGDYFAANRELLVGGPVPRNGHFGREIREEVWAGPDVEIDPGALVVGPVVLGPKCRISSGAQVIGPAALGAGVSVGRSAVVRESILWPDSRVVDEARVDYCVVGDGCVIPKGQRVKASVVLDWKERSERLDFIARMDDQGGRTLIHRHGKIRQASRPSLRHRCFLAAKRMLDIVVSFSALLITAPLFLLVALAIKADSRGTAFFNQKRCGYRGRSFTMYKFRTMGHNAEQLQRQLAKYKDVDGPTFKVFGDPRVTRVGRILRRTSLDELPQLINVLRGEMSLVGPRPLILEEMRCAPNWRDIRLQVKPGMTGLWQVTGRGSVTFEDWVRCDTMYVKQQSMLLDLKILLRTFVVVLLGVGAG